MPNFQNRAAFGDIYTIPTGGIDNIAKQVYREQQIREQQKQQQDKALDDEFAKNVAGVKSSDIPEITSAYNDFKQAHINLQKKGQKATPQDQMDVMLKKAAAFQAINASKEDKERLKQYAATVKSDTKGIYDPNAPQMVNTWLNTPTSKRNFDEDANLKYKYAMPNIDKEIKNAAGVGKDFEVQAGVDEKDPLKDKVEVYKTINPPNVFYNNLFTGLAARSDNKGFTRSVTDNMTDDKKEKLRVAYEAKIQDPKFKALYGDVQPFPASAADTELGQAVALKTMEAFVNLPIEKVKDKSVINADRAATRKEKFANDQMDKRFAHSELMAKLNDQYLKGRKDNPNDPEKNVGWPTEDMANKYGEDMEYTPVGGQKTTRRVIFTDKADPTELDFVRGFIKGKQLGVTPIVFKGGRTGFIYDPNTKDLEGANGQKVSAERARRDVIDKVLNTKIKIGQDKKAGGTTNTPVPAPKVKATTKSGLPVFH